jgi:nicotinamide-nucleotide amidase
VTAHQKNELKSIFDKKGLTLAIAESLTSGLLQSFVASVSGSSSFYLGGITAYTIDAKAKFMGVDHAHATSVNAVSERVVEEMTKGSYEAFGSDVGVSTTGFAEPSEDFGVALPYA